MSEMVERVTRAIDAAVADWQPGCGRDIRESAARAAIAAMREPTQYMISAFYKENYGSATEGWHDMIDAALDTPSQITPNQAGS